MPGLPLCECSVRRSAAYVSQVNAILRECGVFS